MAPFSVYQVNTSPSSAAYMRHWAGSSLVQVTPSHYLNQCWLIVNWTPGSIIKWNLNRNSIIFIQENAIWKCRLPKWRVWLGWVWVCGCGLGVGGWGFRVVVVVVVVVGGGGGGGRGGGGGAEWSVKCLLYTWLGIGANWHHRSVWCTLMSNKYSHGRDSLVGVLFSCILHHVLYCTIYLSRTITRLKMYLVISCGIKYKKISLSLSAFCILCYAGRFIPPRFSSLHSAPC